MSVSLSMRHTNPRATFYAVSFGHFAIDLLNSTGAVIMAFLSAHFLPMSNFQIGFAISGYQFAGSLSQPLAGWLADKTGGRWLGAGGVAWTASFLMLSLFLASTTQNYVLMVIPFIVAALGSGAMHPVGAMHAAEAARHARGAGQVSLFFLAGQMGASIGPVLAGTLLDRAATHFSVFTQALPALHGSLIETGGVQPMLLFVAIAMPSVIYMAFTLPNRQAFAAQRAEAETSGKLTAAVRISARLIALLILVVAMRSLINPGSAAFLPRLFQERGWSAGEYGLVTSLFWLGGGVAGVILGFLAERFDSRWLVAVTLLASAPALFTLPLLDRPWAYGMALTVGALSGASHSLLVVQAQRLIPGRKGFASGAILGFMFAMGAVGSLIIGALSDRVGISGAYQIVAGVTVVTGLLGLGLPPDHTRQPTPAARAEAVPQHAAASGD